MLLVNKSVAVIYSRRPEKSALTPISDEILCGWGVGILEKSNDTVKVRTEYGYEGYMFASDLSEADYTENIYYISARFCDVVPTEEYDMPPIITLSHLSRVRLISAGEKWSKILLPDNRKGFVRTLHIAPWRGIFARNGYADGIDDSKELRQKIVESAKFYLDTPYRWGGKSSFGIDCSGLCFMAYYENGINIYRDAESDTHYTRKIDRSEARNGDLYYFPGHIAMALGEGRFIHSSSALSWVGYNSLTESDDDFNPWLNDSLITAATVFK